MLSLSQGLLKRAFGWYLEWNVAILALRDVYKNANISRDFKIV